MNRSHACALLAFALAAGCGDRVEVIESADGVTRSRHGDTTIVTTTRDGAWGPVHDAVEVARVSGNSRETTFGAVYMIAATPDGGVVIFDAKGAEGMIIRQFSADGKFLRNIGRQGSGPGEYNQAGQLTLAAQPNGTIIVRDGRRALSRYGADGRFINGFTLGLANAGMLDVVPELDGSIYVRGPFPRGAGFTDMRRAPAMLRYDTTGRLLDSVVQGREWVPPQKTPSQFTAYSMWSLLPDKRVYFARNDKIGFLVVDPSGKSPPLIGEADTPPVPFTKEERAEMQALEDFRQRNYPPEMRGKAAPIPEYKAPMRGTVTDIDGRIWIFESSRGQKSAPHVAARAGGDSVMSTYAEQNVLAAFQTDGTFLGEVRFPMGAGIPTFIGNMAWAIVPDADDVPALVKFRIHE